MKHNKRLTILSIITNIIVGGAIIFGLIATYHLKGVKPIGLGLPLILSIYISDCVCSIIMFNSKRCSDELKAFGLFIILIVPISGCIFGNFLGVTEQTGYGLGCSSQVTLLSRIFTAKKSIKIYTNSWFVSYDTFKAINYACLKNVKVDVIISVQKRKQKQKLIQYNINKYLEPKVNIHFTSKTIQQSFIIFDDKEALLNDKNFNYKYMYSKTKINLIEDTVTYLKLGNQNFVDTTIFEHNQKKPIWTKRVVHGLENIFYPFY